MFRKYSDRNRIIAPIMVLLLFGGAFLFVVLSLFASKNAKDSRLAAVEAMSQAALAADTQTPAAAFMDLPGYEGFLPVSLKADSAANLPAYLNLYLDGSGNCFFFLPACILSRHLSFSFDETQYKITLDGAPIHDQDPAAAYCTGETYPLTIAQTGSPDDTSTVSSITFMQSQNLPAVFITTATGSLSYMHASKENREPGTFSCFLPDGRQDSFGSLVSIKCHGNASYLETNKKSYQIAFDADTDVLSMGAASKYILQANAFDASFLRNGIVYSYCRSLNIPYAVDSEYVDLYFNGEYAGNYLVCERVEKAPNRVDLPQDGYLIEKMIADRIEDDDCAFQVDGMNWFIVKDAKDMEDGELSSVSEYMNRVARLATDCDSFEKYEALSKYIDINSFADMYLINAITNDIDSNIASTYYYLTTDGQERKLYAGPVWDYDNAFGRHARGYDIALSAYPSGYCEELFANPYFRADVTDKFNETFYPLMEEYLAQYIPQLQAHIQPSVSMELCRWQAQGYHSSALLGHEDAISYLYGYIRQRMDHLYDRFNHPEQYHHVRFINQSASADYHDSDLWIKDGERIPTDVMEQMAQRFHSDGFRLAGGNAYANTRPVFSDMTLYGN